MTGEQLPGGGSAIRVLLAAAGLSAVLASSALAFNAIRWAGTAYLAWLGIRAFRAGQPEQPAGGPRQPVPLARSVRKGLLVGLANPKMVIFFLAFFPQFIHPAQGPQAAQPRVEGLVYLGLATWAAITGSRPDH